MSGRPLFLIGAIFLCGLLLGLIINMRQSSRERERSTMEAIRQEVAPEPEILARDVEFVQGDEGRVNWRIRASRAEYDQDNGVVDVDHPQMTSYLGRDRREVFVRADVGTVNQQQDSLTLRSNVDGRFGLFSIKAESLDYFGVMQKVFLKGGVSVSRPDISINARAVEINIATHRLVAAGGVTAVLSPDLASIEDQEQLLKAPQPAVSEAINQE